MQTSTPTIYIIINATPMILYIIQTIIHTLYITLIRKVNVNVKGKIMMKERI